jgi:hypothetical protein
LLLLHGYHREQVAPRTGDLPQIENKSVESLLRAELRALKIKCLHASDAVLEVGAGHCGQPALVYGVASKPARGRFMKTVSFSGMALLVLLAGCMTPAAPDPDEVAAAVGRSTAAADLLFQRLSGELATALANGGPAAAVAICKNRAPTIAAEIQAASGVDIARTALRVRNQANAPDDWELATMNSFIARREAGEEWAGMSATRIEGGQLNWMRPIPLGGMCASCHGDPASFTQDTRLALREAYPDDQATGFRPGDLRGAFTARVPLH